MEWKRKKEKTRQTVKEREKERAPVTPPGKHPIVI
jgi:hypothetical protein